MSEAGIRLLLRVTARLSFLLFLAPFAAQAMATLWPSTASRWLARNRDRFLLGFASSHTVHLGGIVALGYTLGWNHIHLSTLIGGGLVYVLIYMLALAALAREFHWSWTPPLANSRKFEAFALYAAWLIFSLAFVGGSVTGRVMYMPLGGAAIGALVVRLMARVRSRRTVVQAA